MDGLQFISKFEIGCGGVGGGQLRYNPIFLVLRGLQMDPYLSVTSKNLTALTSTHKHHTLPADVLPNASEELFCTRL